VTVVEERPAPSAAPPPRRVSPWALLRNSWRQLTSMRTALVLLFLLAVAAIPGSVLPQRSLNPENVRAYFREHPDLAPVLDRLGGFDVYASPWFAAIYLLLFTSLIGCVVPRLADHVRALRMAPPDAPKRLGRLPQSATGQRDDDPAAAATAMLIALAVRSGRLSERAETAIKREMREVMGVAEVEEPFTFAFWLAEQVNDADDLSLKFKTLWLTKLSADERADLHAMASRVAAVDGPPSDAQRASLLLLKDRLGLVGP
jgi:hypothetical protein